MEFRRGVREGNHTRLVVLCFEATIADSVLLKQNEHLLP
jgi:hypothetical protein